MELFKILAIDGGGVRGIYPAHFLDLFEKQHPPSIAQSFDLLIGTSTGSIIAAAAAMGVPMTKVVDLYERNAAAIFKKRSWSFSGRRSSLHDSAPLRNLLEEIFGTATMGSLKTRLLIPTTDISNGNVFVIKSSYLTSFVRDKETKIVDAVMASCAAPSFFDPVRVGEYLLADGGLWANNPSFVAYTEAVGKLEKHPDSVRVLSIGTGTGHRCYDVANAGQKWGLVTGWQGTDLVETVMNIQGRSSSNAATLLLRDKYRRISFEETGSLPLNDPTCMPRLKAKAGEAFTYHHEQVAKFLELNTR